MSHEEEPGSASESSTDADRGSAFVEYIVVTALFSLVVGFALYRLGHPLLSFYRNLQLIWASPFP